MCQKPIRIRNKTRYITPGTGQQMFIWVNCGKCEECRTQKQQEWTMRTYYENLETIQNNGYLMFDTLTYKNEDLPYFEEHETNTKISCFRPQHIREFYESLRQRLDITKDSNIKYFITAEYGEMRNRPHYHIILFVNEEIDPLEMSQQISKAWTHGRTDGIPFRSKKYVLEHNLIKTMNLDAIRYVAKYVNKSTHHMKKVNAKWMKIENALNLLGENKMKIKELKRRYYRFTTPFHRQSQHYGETALNYQTKEDLETECRMGYRTDSEKIMQYCHLPEYFKRKLYYKQIKYNEKPIWVPTEKGIEWKKQTESINIHKIENRLTDAATNKGLKYETDLLQQIAKYIYKTRGRLSGKIDYAAHHKDAQYYQYFSDKDLIYLGHQGISSTYIGNDKTGYQTTSWEEIQTEQPKYNKKFEDIIEKLTTERDTTEITILKEHLEELKKILQKR